MMFCNTHRCRISITGCMLRQQRMQANPPRWMYNKIPGDPKCADCAQGKEIMNKYNRGELTMVETTKTCRYCGTEFVGDDIADNFYRSRNTPDGFEGGCKGCKREKAKERRRAEKGKPKKPREKAAAAPSKVKEKKAESQAPAGKPDTIKKNDQFPELDVGKCGAKDVYLALMDEMIRDVFRRAGYPELYEALEKSAVKNMRPPHLQALFLVSCALAPAGEVSE